MPLGTFRVDGSYRRAVRDVLLLTLPPLLDTSQVTPRTEVSSTQAVTDDEIPAVATGGWRSAAEHAHEVIEALGGAVSMDEDDKRAFGRLIADHTERVDVAYQVEEVPERGF